MFGPLGVQELIFIFALALLIFGPRKLPEIGRTIGKGLAEFRKASTDLKRTINAEMIEEEIRSTDPRKILREDLDAGPKKTDASTSDGSTSEVATSDAATSDAVASDAATSDVSTDTAAGEPVVNPAPAPGTVSRGTVSRGTVSQTSVSGDIDPDATEDVIPEDPAVETPIEPASK